MAAILVGLNAASYTQKETKPDSESSPNRSTYNAGATGTQAFYSLLSETGRKVMRWQESPAGLATAKANNKPAVFVVAGRLRRDFTDQEVEELLRWVSGGGRLVVIDREPPEKLITTTANWRIEFKEAEVPEFSPVDPTEQKLMIGDTAAVKPVQPTVYTQGVNAVQPSKYAASILFERFVDGSKQGGQGNGTRPAPPPATFDQITESDVPSPSEVAPVAHFAADGKNLVVDAPFGSGRIVFVADPYIVSNGGISLVDNAQLGINLVAAGNGIIAFDEFHHGYGTDNNRFLQFFAGTPVVAIFLQAAALIAFVFYSQSRRFARAVPEPEPDRLSKLEYVAAMAELQSRTKSFDLAIENIYGEFRRRAARYFGLDNYTATSREIAALIAERGGFERSKIEGTLFMCEEIIRGEPTNKREVLGLAGDLREIEQKLGMTRAGRTRV